MRTRALELTLFFLGLSACGAANDQVATGTSTSALTAGPQVSGEGEPYDAMVKLVTTNNGRTRNGATCSGTVIAKNRVLTSAKCLTDNVFSPQRVCITSRNQDAQCDLGAPTSEHYYIRKTAVHPSFTGTSAGSDVAVVQFDRTITHFSQGVNAPIAPLPIDDQVFSDGLQGTVFGFGANSAHPTFVGTKQMYTDVASVTSSFPNYIAVTAVNFLTGDLGGGIISGFNKVAGVQSFNNRGTSYLTRTQPIRAWIQSPPNVASVPTCTLTGQFLYSTIAGKCLEATGTSGTALNFCQCKTSQRFTMNPVETLNSLTNQGNQRCLTGQSEAFAPTLEACSGTIINQQWQIAGGGLTTQLTSRNGQTLLTSTMNAAVMGPSSYAMRWWQLK